MTVEFHGLFKNGGIGTANTALALALAGEGFEVTVAIANPEAQAANKGVNAELCAHYAGLGVTLELVPALPALAGQDGSRAASYAVYRYLRSHSFDIVMFNDNGGQGFYTLLAKRVGLYAPAPLLCVVAHGPLDWVASINCEEYSFRGVTVAYMESRSVGLADMLISPSRYLLDWMAGEGWVQPGEGYVLQNLIGTAARPVATRGIPALRPIEEIVFFGRQETRKGIDLFCDAIDLLDGDADLSEVRITFLGKFSKSAWLHSGVYLVERARHWRAQLRVITEFDQEAALSYLHRPGVLAVIPSRAENSPCVVAECLIQGVPFLASSEGGTAELIAEPDRRFCLFSPNAETLAARLQESLRTGQPPARLSVPQAETTRQWVSLLTTAQIGRDDVSMTAPPALTISVCLAWTELPSFKTCLAVLAEQSQAPLEIIVVGPDEAAFNEASCGGATKITSAFAGRAAARNIAAAAAIGDYLCMIDEIRAVPERGALAALAAAVGRTGAEIVTGMAALENGGSLLLGACVELGITENCFSGGIWMVSRSVFASSGGFSTGGREGACDWAYLARSVLAGVRLELVPEPLVRLQPTAAAVFAGARIVEDHRALLDTYSSQPLSRIAKLVESRLHWQEARRLALTGFIAQLPAAVRATVQSLGALEPNNAEARRLFSNYCCGRHLPDLALDYALYNDAALLPGTVAATVKSNEAAARRALNMHSMALRHSVDLTVDLASRARAFHGLKPEALQPEPEGIVRYQAPNGLSVVKFSGACPPGTAVVTVTATANALSALRIAAVLCRAWGRPRLTLESLEQDDEAWWSGWGEVTHDQPGTLTLRLAEPSVELLDLYLVASWSELEPTGIVWQRVQADLLLTGGMTPSALEVAELTTPLPASLLTKGELLTDLTGVNFAIYRAGPPTMLHPLTDRLAVVRFANAVPANAAGLNCEVSLGHTRSRPVSFGLWARPVGSPTSLPLNPEQEPHFSGWTSCEAVSEPKSIRLFLPRPGHGPWDIYLATRLVNQPDAHFCHALWTDIAIIERAAAAPVSPPPTAPSIISAASLQVPPQSYIICAGPRTGSNLLATSLRNSGVAGSPLEYFNAATMNSAFMLECLGVAPSKQPDFYPRLPQILRAGTLGGMFGATVHWWDKEYLLAALRRAYPALADASPLDLLHTALPNLQLFLLRREDKLAQAVSHYTAKVTGTWYRNAKTPTENLARVIPFDFDAIDVLVKDAITQELGWDVLLQATKSKICTIKYEEFAADFEGTISRALRFLGKVVPRSSLPKPPLERQANARSSELINLYLAEQERRVAIEAHASE